MKPGDHITLPKVKSDHRRIDWKTLIETEGPIKEKRDTVHHNNLNGKEGQGLTQIYEIAKRYHDPQFWDGTEFSPQLKRGRKALLSEEDELKIVEWVKKIRRKSLPLTYRMVQTKAQVMYPTIQLGAGWLEGFKSRHKLTLRVPSKIAIKVGDRDIAREKRSAGASGKVQDTGLPHLQHGRNPLTIFDGNRAIWKDSRLRWQ